MAPHPLRAAIAAAASDAKFAVRYFARQKTTTAIIVAVLALGTGANTVIFSMMQGLFTRPAPAVPADPQHIRLYAQERATPTAKWESREFTRPEFVALAAHRETFADLAAWSKGEVILRGDSTFARGVGAQFVTPNYFPALGVPLVAGLGLRPVDANETDLSAVMAHAVAVEFFGIASSAVGRRVLVNEVPVTIVGVSPERFQGALRSMSEPALWMPLSARAQIERISERWMDDNAVLSVFARVGANSSRAQATALTQQVLTRSLPDSATRVGMARMGSVEALQSLPPGELRTEMLLVSTMMSLLGLTILLVAWMNVGSLMVAAAVARRQEIAVRLSLGASRLRVVGQLVTESTLLASAGGALGLVIAYWLLLYNQKTEIDGVNIMPDGATLLFVFAMAIATGVAFGLSPALHATRGDVASALRDSGANASSRTRLQRGFVVAQIALSQPLLVLLGMMLSLVIADYRPLAPEMSRQVIRVAFRPLNTAAEGQRVEAVEQLTPRIAQNPEVVGAVPEAEAFEIRRIAIEGDTVERILNLEGTAPGWFDLVDVPIILGRDVSLDDTAATDYPVVIGSDIAQALFGDASPIGRVIASPPITELGQDSAATFTIIGVYDASKKLPGITFDGAAVRNSMTVTLVRAYTARGKVWAKERVLVRTRGPADGFLTELQRIMKAEAPSLPVASTRTLAQIDEEEYQITMRVSAVAGAGGALALLLASLGLYGVVSLAVRQRTREIGVRIAVGAEPIQVARMFLKSGVMLGVIGLAIGLPLSIVVLKVVAASEGLVVLGVNPYLIGSVISVLLLSVAALATWIPARRATLVDPASALRTE